MLTIRILGRNPSRNTWVEASSSPLLSGPASALNIQLSHIYTPPLPCWSSQLRKTLFFICLREPNDSLVQLPYLKPRLPSSIPGVEISCFFTVHFPLRLLVFCPSPISSPPLQAGIGQSYPCALECAQFSGFHYIFSSNKVVIVINQSLYEFSD